MKKLNQFNFINPSSQSGLTALQAIIGLGCLGVITAMAMQTFHNKSKIYKLAFSKGETQDLRYNIFSGVSCKKTAEKLKSCNAKGSALYDHYGRDVSKTNYKNFKLRIGCEEIGDKLWEFTLETKNNGNNKWKNLRDGIPLVCEIAQDEKCWFATSGTFIGHNSNPRQGSVFPNTKSGNPIGHGEYFDDVGGVYLEARKEPYEYGKGKKYIDTAVKWTFDGIAIAPDMHALIKNSSGKVLIDSDGPIIAMSQHYAGRKKWYTDLLKSNPNIPLWMTSYVENDEIKVIKLQSARYVKVTPIAGSSCDN
jgi:hypothetical protein